MSTHTPFGAVEPSGTDSNARARTFEGARLSDPEHLKGAPRASERGRADENLHPPGATPGNPWPKGGWTKSSTPRAGARAATKLQVSRGDFARAPHQDAAMPTSPEHLAKLLRIELASIPAYWFCALWAENEWFWELLEGLMREVARAVSPVIRTKGWLAPHKVPSLSEPLVVELAALVEGQLEAQGR